MNFEQDYMERVIRAIGKMIVAIVDGKDAIATDIENENYDMKLSDDDLLEIMVKKYLMEENINEAENIIYDAIKSRNIKKSYEIAINFYSLINKFSDKKLLDCNFSREEILEGLEGVKKIQDNKLNEHY